MVLSFVDDEIAAFVPHSFRDEFIDAVTIQVKLVYEVLQGTLRPLFQLRNHVFSSCLRPTFVIGSILLAEFARTTLANSLVRYSSSLLMSLQGSDSLLLGIEMFPEGLVKGMDALHLNLLLTPPHCLVPD